MFANLKKKIEEEVGDLGRLASPLTSTFDRRVNSNTPSVVSRQSSVSSLADAFDEARSPRGNSLHPNSSAASETSEIKKVNTDWRQKWESQKKAFEERLQNQEADFAWKLSSKNEEIERLKDEKRKIEETLRNSEVRYKERLIRAQDDIDQLEGLSKMENSKVKHLLLNTQEEFEKCKTESYQKEVKINQINEELEILKTENGLLKNNLERFAVKSINSNTDQSKTKSDEEVLRLTEQIQILEAFKNENSDRLVKIREENKEKETKMSQEIQHLRSENEKLVNLQSNESDKFKYMESTNERLDGENNDLLFQISNLQKKKDELTGTIKILTDKIDAYERDLRDKVQQIQILEAAKNENSDRLIKIQKENNEKETQMNQNIKILTDNLEASGFDIRDKIQQIHILETTNNENSNRLVKIQEESKEKETKMNQEIQILRSENEKLLNLQSNSDDSDKCKYLESTIERLKGENKDLLFQVSGFQKRKDEMTEENKTLTDKLDASGLDLREKIQQIQSLEAFKNENSNRLVKIQEESKEKEIKMNQEIQNLRSENEKLLNLQSNDLDKYKILESNFERLQNENKDLLSQVSDLQGKKVELAEEIKSLTVKIDASGSDLRGKINQIQILEATKNENSERLMKIQNESKEKETKMIQEIQHLGSENEKLINLQSNDLDKCKNLESTIERLHSENKDLLFQVSELKVKKVELAEEIKTLTDTIDATTLVLGEKSQQIQILEAFKNENSDRLVKIQDESNEKEIKMSEEIQILRSENEKLLNLQSNEDESDKCKHLESTIERLECENNDLLFQVSDLQGTKDELTEEIKFLNEKIDSSGTDLRDKIEILEGKLGEKAKALKVSNQQLQDLRKSLAHEIRSGEMKNDTSSSPLLEVTISEEGHEKGDRAAPENVNFQYMRSVLIKFLTTKDQQVTQQLIRVVATLLELNPEEERLLHEASDTRTWSILKPRH